MEPILEEICKSLDDLSDSITKAYTDDRTMTEIWGWNFPPLNRHDLAFIPKNISEKIKEHGQVVFDDQTRNILIDIPIRISLFKKNSLPYFFNGHGQQAVPIFISLIEWISAILNPMFGLSVLQDNKAMPTQLARRLRGIQAELNEIAPEKENLKKQIDLIKEATEAAETLPTDLQSLKESRNKVDKLSTDSATLFGKIETFNKEADEIAKKLRNKKEEAEKLVQQCEEAYRITTTKGLAAAFDQRANKLSTSTWIWVLGLLITLGIGAWIGSHRVEVLSELIKSPTPQWTAIWMHLILSILSIGAPIWFAWLATKQINQRFRLSEDYAFKASVAKAYEGYRKEAARIDEAFEARLFSSALTRLEEAPLRLVETDHHGSPWHEFFNSPAFQRAMDTVPEFKAKFIEIAKDKMTFLKSKPQESEVTEN